jgi:excisionase family DNA binding protein
MQRYTTTTEAARMLDVSEATVRLLAIRGELSTVAMAGHRRLFDPVEVKALADRRSQLRREREAERQRGPEPAA